MGYGFYADFYYDGNEVYVTKFLNGILLNK